MHHAASHQGVLEKSLKLLFPGEHIKTNARWGTYSNPDTGRSFELDAWLPNLGLVFEFQDVHHYLTTWYYQRSVAAAAHSDQVKKEVIRRCGEWHIEIPVWWDSNLNSLRDSILFARPDLFSALPVIADALPIPITPSNGYFPEGEIPEIGEAMLASFVSTSIPPIDTEWWMGEKYDGVRCIWSYSHQKLYSRRGSEMYLPLSVQLACSESESFMDCELWRGRGLYADLANQSYEKSDHVCWAAFRLIVFDNPDPLTNHFPFELRYHSLVAAGVGSSLPLIVAARMSARSEVMVEWMMHEISSDAGEGVILRKPMSLYEHGRSNSLVKRKLRQSDVEALVLEIECDDRYLVQLPNGHSISVQSTISPSSLRLRIGDVVTIAFDYTRDDDRDARNGNYLVDPAIIRVRKDVHWEDVIRDARFTYGKLNSARLTDHSYKTGNWTTINDRRAYFDTLARTLRFDPLEPENWYSLSPDVVQTLKDHPILHYYNNNYVTALVHLYPNIGLTKAKFEAWGYLKLKSNRSHFLHEAIGNAQHDSFITENWQTLDTVEKLPMFDFYRNTLVDYLAENWVPEDHHHISQGWQSLARQREFFYTFAKRHLFDPLQPTNWYGVSRDAILSAKGGHSVLAHHEGSYVKALMRAIPEIHLEENKFKYLTKNYWSNIDNRRAFFINFANKQGFDPLTPADWYSCSYWELRNEKQCPSVLAHYKGDVGQALLHVFPGIGLDPVRLNNLKFASEQSREDTPQDSGPITNSMYFM